MSTITTKDGPADLPQGLGQRAMSEPLTRRGVLIGALTLVVAAAGGRLDAAAKPSIAVHKSPT